MSIITGYPDLDIIILSELDDEYLSDICKVNKYVNSLCQDEMLWYRKNQNAGYPDIKCKECQSWKQTYFQYKDYQNNYGYLVKNFTEMITRVFPTFEEAKAFMMSELNIQDINDLHNTVPKYSIGIYFFKYSQPLATDDPESALLVIDSSEDGESLSTDALPWNSPFNGLQKIYVNPNLQNMVPLQRPWLNKFWLTGPTLSPVKYNAVSTIFKSIDDVIADVEDRYEPRYKLYYFYEIDNITGESKALALSAKGEITPRFKFL